MCARPREPHGQYRQLRKARRPRFERFQHRGWALFVPECPCHQFWQQGRETDQSVLVTGNRNPRHVPDKAAPQGAPRPASHSPGQGRSSWAPGAPSPARSLAPLREAASPSGSSAPTHTPDTSTRLLDERSSGWETRLSSMPQQAPCRRLPSATTCGMLPAAAWQGRRAKALPALPVKF